MAIYIRALIRAKRNAALLEPKSYGPSAIKKDALTQRKGQAGGSVLLHAPVHFIPYSETLPESAWFYYPGRQG